MPKMDIRKLDLNLLVVFQTLCETHSVTLAAARQHSLRTAAQGAGRGVGSSTLFSEHYVVLMRGEHPLEGKALTRRDFLASEHALVCTDARSPPCFLLWLFSQIASKGSVFIFPEKHR